MRNIRVIRDKETIFLTNVHTNNVRITTDGIMSLSITGITDIELERGNIVIIPNENIYRNEDETLHYFQVTEFRHDRLSGQFTLSATSLVADLGVIIDIDVPVPDDPPEGWVARTHRNATVMDIMKSVQEWITGEWSIEVNDNEELMKIDYNMANKRVMEVILELADLFGYLVEIDNDRKVIRFYKTGTHPDFSNHGISVRNMANLERKDSEKRLFTHLLLTGKDGMTIESVNGSKWLIDEVTYERLGYAIYEKFSDGRFTIPRNLMKKGLELIQDNRKDSMIMVSELDNFRGIAKDFRLGDRVFFEYKDKAYDLYIMQIDLDLIDPDNTKLQLGGSISSSIKTGTWENNVMNNLVGNRIDEILNEINSKDRVLLTNVSDTLTEMGTSIDEQKELFLEMFVEAEEETKRRIEELNNDWDIQFENSPKMTVDWMNENVGILNGDTVMLNSLYGKHMKYNTLEGEHLKANAVTVKQLKVDNALIDTLSSKIVISDLVMAGKIVGNNSYWDLNNGDLKNGKGKFFNYLSQGKFATYDNTSNPTMVLDGKSLRLYDKLRKNDVVGRIYASQLTDSGDLGHFSIRHAYRKSLGIAREVSADSTLGDPYIMFDYHNRSNMTKKGYPITFGEAVSFTDKIHLRGNELHIGDDNRRIVAWRGGMSMVNRYNNGLHVSQSGQLYHRKGGQVAKVQVGKYFTL